MPRCIQSLVIVAALALYSAPLCWGLGPVRAQAGWIIRIGRASDSDSWFF
jgi:hypothetical protein